MKMLKKLLLALLAGIVLIAAGSAFAQEEEVFEATGKLLWLGEFPDEPARSPEVVERGSFASDVLAGLRAQKSTINVKSHKLTKDQFTSAYFALLNDHPELFYVDGYIKWNTSGGYVNNIYPRYLYSGADLNNRIAAFNATVNTIVKHAQQSTTPLGQILLVNDYFCREYEYDYTYSIYRPDLFFTNKTGVCQAYTLAYKAVLDKLGIVSTTATSETMNHIWNVVQLDGAWYHIDVTWNDPPSDYAAGHWFFLLSDTGITNASHYGWITSVKASDTRYDGYFWENITTTIPVIGHTAYYLEQTGSYRERNIIAWNLNTGSSNVVHNYSIMVDGTMSENHGYDPVAADSQRVYYALANKLYSVNASGGDVQLEHIAAAEGSSIFYMVLENGVITMVAGTNPDYPETCHTVSLVVGTTLSISLPNARENITQGTQRQLVLSYNMAPSVNIPFYWASSNESVATVYDGLVTAIAPGAARISAVHGRSLYAECLVLVHYPSVVTLPANTTAIGAETFANVQMQEVVLPNTVTEIGERTFAGCTELRMVIMPEGDVKIAENAFEGCSEISFLCRDGSAAQAYALANGFDCELLP